MGQDCAIVFIAVPHTQQLSVVGSQTGGHKTENHLRIFRGSKEIFAAPKSMLI